MIKQTIIAAGVFAATIFAFQPQEAEAGTKFHLHIGVPYYGYNSGHYYGTPYYGSHYYEPRRVYKPRPRYRHRVGCRQARRILRHRGFHHIRTKDCYGHRYVFKARKHGDWWIVKMNSRNARIVRARPI